ncbi:MAG TPA: DinB family protein [Ignavibacteria bacterium]|nr:DinB family protein [Ignavibacteria bacterium]HMQ98809.1 DinB family protein [Ignavibacteria bacterium]
MNTKVNCNRIEPLLFLYDLHTQLFPNVITGISADDAHKRLDSKANHVAWLAGSLVQQRVDLVNDFGGNAGHSAEALFSNFQGIKDDTRYPELDTYDKDWQKVSKQLRDILAETTGEKLDSIHKQPGMPEIEMPYFDMLGYSIHRESYLIGQIGLWRRILGYPAMKYPGM